MNKIISFLVLLLSLITTAQAQTTIIEKDLDTVVLSSPDCIVAVKKYVPPTINQRPFARAGADFSVTLPTSQFQLDATASSDPDGFIKSYGWRKIAGPSVTIPISYKAIISVTNASTVGIYSFELRVVDNLGLMAADTVKVAVVNPVPINQPPIANAGPDITITLPQTSVQLDGSRSSDIDGIVQSFAWRRISGVPVSIANADRSIATVSNLKQGVYAFELRVGDNSGAFRSDTLRVVVNPAVVVNQPPNAVAVAAPSSITLPTTTVNLSAASSSDADGAILSWLWEKVAGPPVGTIANVSASESVVTGLTAAGVYTYRLTVTDNEGAKSSANVNVTVNPEIVNPPEGQPFNFSLTKNTAFKPRKFSGTEDWNGQYYTSFTGGFQDKYFRYCWTDIEKQTQGNYVWTRFDQEFLKAINAGAKFSFGIMTVCDSDDFLAQEIINGSSSRYPKYVHDRMQTESVKDYAKNGQWIPNWNSAFFLDRFDALLKAIQAHIISKGWQDKINYVDIRGYGQWGEWHSVGFGQPVSSMPAGTRPTVATYKRFVDGHIAAFPDYQLVMLLAALDAEWLDNTMTPKEVTDYILKAKNNVGLIGVRRDQWGATDGYVHDYLENNNRNWNGGPAFKIAIMDRYKTAPWVGEPMGPGSNLSDLQRQVTFYHAVSVGNGNYTADGTSQGHFKNAEAAAGYRLALGAGDGKFSKTSLTVNMSIENFGLTPCYEAFDLVYELRNSSGTKVASFTSNWKARLKLPGTHSTGAETWIISSPLPAGTYSLVATFKNTYRSMPLFNNGQGGDGYITLKTGLTVSNQ